MADRYEKHLNKKIYDKLLQKVLLIQPSEAFDEKVEVDLGFCEEEYKGTIEELEHTHTNKNWSMWDGGHVGGGPVWLNPKARPTDEELTCKVCNSSMLFLLQLYAPIDDETNLPNAFHRTVYVFCCKNEKCISKGGHSGFRVFRSQLPRKNEFYPFDELTNDQTIFDNNKVSESNVREAQGAKGEKNIRRNDEGGSSTFQFKLYEIVSESEIDCLNDVNAVINDKFKDVIQEQINKPKTATEEGQEEEEEDVAITQSDIDGVMNAITDNGKPNTQASANGGKTKSKGSKNTIVSKTLDKSMTYFHHRVDIAKDQILRYARWKTGEELFFSDKNRPNVLETIPKCPHCNGPRLFEFQIMPQLLSYLNLEDVPGPGELDWGGIYIYTCKNSCSDGSKCLEESVWCQPGI